MGKNIDERLIIKRSRIKKMVKELGRRIENDYKGKELLLIGVLNGAFIFLSDLIREINIPMEIDFIAVSSYGDSTKSTGVVKITKDIDQNIQNKHVIIVEDIVDTGLTINYLVEILKAREPLSLKICAAFNKPSRRLVNVEVEYNGIEVPDEFIVGYGLDLEGKYRNSQDVLAIDSSKLDSIE